MDAGLALIRSGQLLYTDDVGRDACGIGGVTSKDGKPTAEVVRKALTALKALEHRGGICGDAGDGAGLTCQIPQSFFKEEAKRLKFDQARYLKPEDRLAIGVFFFLDQDKSKIDRAKEIIHETLLRDSVHNLVHWFGWRSVPTNDNAISDLARKVRPGSIEQLLLRCKATVADVEMYLYRSRLELRQKFLEAGLNVYIPSLSARLISYKALATSPQFVQFY